METLEDFLEFHIFKLKEVNADAISLDKLRLLIATYNMRVEKEKVKLIECCPKCRSKNVFDMYPNHNACSDCGEDWDGTFFFEIFDN
jgi:transposase-like protein